MADGFSIRKALDDIGETPCEATECMYTKLCAQDAMCCDVWRFWVQTNRIMPIGAERLRAKGVTHVTPRKHRNGVIERYEQVPDMTLMRAERMDHA